METAKLFQNGSSQAVRLPKAFRISGNEVKIFKKGNQVILEPIEMTWDSLFESLSEFPEDFMKDGRNQPGFDLGDVKIAGRCQLLNLREEHKALAKPIPISLPPTLVLSRCRDLLLHKNQLFLEVCPWPV